MKLRSIFVMLSIVGATAGCATSPPAAQRPAKDWSQVPSGCGAQPPASNFVEAMGRGGLVTMPPGYQSSQPYPLLVSLHPFSLGPGDWESYSNLANAAADRGYLVISPLGSDPGPRWAVPGGLETGADDMSYVDLLLDKVTAGWCVDHSRIFAAGFSAGAAMAVGLSCVLPDRFRGIAGSGGSNLTTLCPGSDGVAAMILHGTADPIAPITGSETPTAPPLGLHLNDVLASFADRNGCSGTPTNQSLTASVTRWTYQACASATPLVHMELHGAGHTWAGAPAFPLIDLIVGSTDMSVSANMLVLDFFDAL